MDRDTYIATLKQAWLFASLARNIPAAPALESARHADSAGWVLDPTLWSRNVYKLEQDMQVLKALAAFQDATRSLLAPEET
jgi:hypothetical protein